MNVAEFLERLGRYFGSGGVIGTRLLPVVNAEQNYGTYVEDYVHGYRVLTESFHDFYVETLDRAAVGAFHGQLPQTDQTYAWLYLTHVTNFRSLRAAENLLLRGYPLDGYALLRDLKDRALYLGAVVGGLSTIPALNGLRTPDLPPKGWTWEDYQKVRNSRKKEERRVKKLMIGNESGLDEADLNELKKWDEFFHEEVHGSRLTFIGVMKTMLIDKQLPSLNPAPDNKGIGMYVNRSNEICWLFLRTLPFLQLSPRAFGEEWKEKWQVLDESFRLSVEGLSERDKKIAASFIIALVDAKFPFSPETAYVERR